MSRFNTVSVLTTAELVAHGLVCPPGGTAACDNAGECGLCLLEVPPSLVSNCPYGKSLPHCRAGNVEFGQYCEASGLQEVEYSRTVAGPGYVCGTHKHVNSCFGGFDTYVNVFCAGTSPQRPPPPPSPLPLAPPPPAPVLPPGVPPPTVVRTPTSQILVAVCIPAGFLVLFCMALLVYRVVRRRSTARVEQEHRAYQAKLSGISSEYNSSVLYAVKSIATYAHTSASESVEMSTLKPAKFGEVSDDCSVCMEAFKEGDSIKILPCNHTVRLPAPGRSSSTLSLYTPAYGCAHPQMCPPARSRGSSTCSASTRGYLARAARHQRLRRPCQGCRPARCARRCRSKSQRRPCPLRHAPRSRHPCARLHLQRRSGPSSLIAGKLL